MLCLLHSRKETYTDLPETPMLHLGIDTSHASGCNSNSSFNISNHMLEVVEDFVYLGSTISAHLSLDKDIGRHTVKVAALMANLSQRVWENKIVTTNTSIRVYQARVLSMLLYSSETWPTYRHQERCQNTFHMHCLKCIVGITWKNRIPYCDTLAVLKSLVCSPHSINTTCNG